ncbi:hypothetical protein PF011_g817 [Phytophthora fragariae]|uniref:Uncharacterized protein n=1 Tax=Phytophthora fragariae TaxID=53985 RepID=A0A6A3MEP4_9STRA|nr:hypothetical protein PF011_g817 [Phytophthora fragariae]
MTKRLQHATKMNLLTNEERPVPTGYATTTEENQPSVRATGVLVNKKVSYDLVNDEIVNEEPSERAPGVLTTDLPGYSRTHQKSPATRLFGGRLWRSEQAPRGAGTTTEEFAPDVEEPYLRTEEPSERAIGALTTEEVAYDLEDDY